MTDSPFMPQLRNIRAELERSRSQRAAAKRERDTARASLAESDVPPVQLVKTAEFRAAETVSNRVEDLDTEIHDLEAAELGILRAMGANPSRTDPVANGPSDSDPSDTWTRLAAGLDPFKGGRTEVGLGGLVKQAGAGFTPPNPATPSLVSIQGPRVDLGKDERRLYAVFPSGGPVDPASVSITDWRTTSRSVTEGSGDGVERGVFSADEKAELNVGLELASDPLSQFALVCSQIPVKLAAIVPQFSAFLQAELAFSLENVLDEHCVRELLASAPQAGQTGANLVEQTRHGIAALRNQGARPDTLIVGSDDSVALDLLKDGDDSYLYAPSGSGQAWKLAIVEVPQTICENPIVLDSQRAAALYRGSATGLTDPYGENLKRNQFTVRLEFEAKLHVRDPLAVYVVDGS